MNSYKFIFSVLFDKHTLSFAGRGITVVWPIKSFGAVLQLITFIAAVNTFLLTAQYIRADSLRKKATIRAAAKCRTASSTPFSKKTMVAGKSAIGCYVNIFSCILYNFCLPLCPILKSSVLFFSFRWKIFSVYSWIFTIYVFFGFIKFKSVFFI